MIATGTDVRPLEYLDNIVDVIATSVAVTAEDLHGMPFDQHGGVYGFMDAFGDRATAILEELSKEPVQ